MIAPTILKGELVERFREHLLEFNYYHIIYEGKNNSCIESRSFNIYEANLIINNFINSNIPIVCMAGSKSSIPFFDYHCAVNIDKEKGEAYVYELLVKESKEENLIKGLVMALYVMKYFLKSDKCKIERLIVPLLILGCEDNEEFVVENIISENKAILYLKNIG
ncbi:hypothetical protein SAMN02745163_00416 [Clostridium cavendishii DSM 21758]|uniref:Uncharacterized protein n=1 Tax=Clostridium cavendishii DSM 21758 TaxID=1121302 RepID=A0A1M6CA66_9CLOT|nr:hypothetical protein [Clostridium cavendishii]SHI57886.1 hypothetical protein SAMN02745163_00416 [Clostridium cavendishii DSM 21758]